MQTGKRYTEPTLAHSLGKDYSDKMNEAFLATKVAVEQYARERGGNLEDGGACIAWTAFGAIELNKRGIAVVPQAGTMMWRIINDCDALSDDECTWFGYRFLSAETEDEFGVGSALVSIAALATGFLPEMHAWLADATNRIIIDFSTNGLHGAFVAKDPISSRSRRWLRPMPPEYLVGGEDLTNESDIAHRFHYLPDVLAIGVATTYIHTLIPQAIAAFGIPEKVMGVVLQMSVGAYGIRLEKYLKRRMQASPK